MTFLTLFLFMFAWNSLPWAIQPLDHLRDHFGDQYCSCQLRRRLRIQSKLRTVRRVYCPGLFVRLHYTSRRLYFRIRNQGWSSDSLEITKTTTTPSVLRLKKQVLLVSLTILFSIRQTSSPSLNSCVCVFHTKLHTVRRCLTFSTFPAFF